MIVLCEPQCLGFEHAAFNAALLATVREAYPDDEIFFFGDESHLQEVENISKSANIAPTRAVWRPVKIIPPKLSGLRRLPVERALVQSVLAQARGASQQTAARGILFCSTTEITILALVQLLRSSPVPCPVRVVVHGVLGTLLEERWRNPRRWGFSLRQAFRLPHPASLEYIVLSDSIREHALRTEPALCPRLHAINMPHLWGESTIVPTRDSSNPVGFGYFGRTVKGFPQFYEIASRVKAKHPAARFSLIGFLNGYDLRRPYEENIVEGLSRVPVSQEEYVTRAAQMDYAVWLADPAHYSLTASATFLDAFDYLKPIIYLANPYIDAYAEKLGDIGYRCETLSEMEQVIEELARSFPTERYQKQCAALIEGRKLFAPSSVAPRLRAIMEKA